MEVVVRDASRSVALMVVIWMVSEAAAWAVYDVM